MAWDGQERRDDGNSGGAERRDVERLVRLEERFNGLDAKVDRVAGSVDKLGVRVEDTRTIMHDMRGDMQKLVAVASAGGTALGVMVKLGSMILGAVAGLGAIGWWLWQHVRLVP